MKLNLVTKEYFLSIQNFLYPQQLPKGSNANSITVTGLYIVSQADNNVNYPVSANGVMEVYMFANQYIKQVYTHYDGTSWVRMYWGNKWYNWKQV